MPNKEKYNVAMFSWCRKGVW